MKKAACIFSLFILVISCKTDTKAKNESINTTLSGPVFGTGYSVIYASEIDYTKQFDSLFDIVNQSMSTYIPNSEISKLNRNEPHHIDDHFQHVFLASKKIYKDTDGAFDPTIGNVVNAWSFGADKNKFLTDTTTIDSLMRFVGLDKVTLMNHKISKSTNTYLEFNAIAKGYGVDVIGTFLESKHIEKYLVNIGGELRALGVNKEKNRAWTVGVDKPRFDGLQDSNDYVIAVHLENASMATSGTYRKFKIDKNGNRYAHIINPKTGYPSKTNILSVSVIAEDCMIADAYATAFQAMGIEKVKTFLQSHPELKVFIIFENDKHEFETLNLNNFPK